MNRFRKYISKKAMLGLYKLSSDRRKLLNELCLTEKDTFSYRILMLKYALSDLKFEFYISLL